MNIFVILTTFIVLIILYYYINQTDSVYEFGKQPTSVEDYKEEQLLPVPNSNEKDYHSNEFEDNVTNVQNNYIPDDELVNFKENTFNINNNGNNWSYNNESQMNGGGVDNITPFNAEEEMTLIEDLDMSCDISNSDMTSRFGFGDKKTFNSN